MFLSTVCGDSNFLSTILFVKTVILIILFVVPSIFIIMNAYTLFTIVTSPDAESKKQIKTIAGRIVAISIVYFVPLIVSLFFNMLSSAGIGFATTYKTCMEKATPSYIKELKNKEEEEQATIDAKEKAELEKAKKEREEVAKKREEARKKNEEESKKAKKSNISLDKNEKKKVVFIGNSKTYVKDIPSKFKEIANNGGYQVEVSDITSGGKTLLWHSVNNESKLKNNYDIAILQEQTDSMESNLTQYTNGASNVAGYLRNGNSKITIYVRQCWGYKHNINNNKHKAVQNNAESVAKSINGYVIKDGEAWDKGMSYKDLYADDTHQNQEGAYLSALCIYKSLTGDDPTKITYYAGIDKNLAIKFQKIAKDTC